jgi:hypothetical protein
MSIVSMNRCERNWSQPSLPARWLSVIHSCHGQSLHPASSRIFFSAFGLLLGTKAKAVGIPSLLHFSKTYIFKLTAARSRRDAVFSQIPSEYHLVLVKRSHPGSTAGSARGYPYPPWTDNHDVLPHLLPSTEVVLDTLVLGVEVEYCRGGVCCLSHERSCCISVFLGSTQPLSPNDERKVPLGGRLVRQSASPGYLSWLFERHLPA